VKNSKAKNFISVLVIYIVISTLLSFQALADDQSSTGAASLFSFGPACGSAGQWTQRAMQDAQRLINIINSLKDDPNCKGITNLISYVEDVKTAQPVQTNTDSQSETPEQMQNKMAAFASVAISPDRNLAPFASKAQKAFTSEALMNMVQSAYDPGGTSTNLSEIANGGRGSVVNFSKLMSFLQANGGRSANISGNLLSQFAQNLPNYQKCLVGRPDALAVALTSIVSIGASIAGSGGALSPTMGGMVKSILDLVQNQKFSGAISGLNQAQLNQSLSCLMEVSTESYCSVLDMQHLIKSPELSQGVKSLSGKKGVDKAIAQKLGDSKSHDRSGATPLSGYYILTVHLPNIYRWVQTVQFGVPAYWGTDALFKNQTEALVSTFKQKANTLPTFLADASSQIAKLPSSDARKHALLDALRAIVGLIKDLSNSSSANSTNFFLQSVNEYVLPFYLLDEQDHVPECIYKTISGTPCDPFDQLFQPGVWPKLDNFDSNYLDLIKRKLQALIDDSTAKASVYYQSRVIVNYVNLAIDSLIGTNYSVKDSLEFVLNYLRYLENFITTQGGDDPDLIKIIPGIITAQSHFSKILEAYDELDDLRKLDRHAVDYTSRVEAGYKKVINEVYTQFDILWQRDGYVVSTLNNFVSAEYVLRIKKNLGLGEYERQFLLVSGRDLLETIKSAYFTNQSDIENDLASAQRINVANLEGIEQVFRSNFYTTIQNWNLRIAGKDLTRMGVNQVYDHAAYMDANIKGTAQEDNPIIMKICGVFGTIGRTLCARFLNPDLYPSEHSFSPLVMGRDHDGVFKRGRDILCVQSLAFVKNDRFKSKKDAIEPGICDHVKLQSQYWKEIPDANKKEFANLNVDYDQLLNASETAKTGGDPDARDQATDNAICAYRNWRRNNIVYFMTKDIDQRINQPMSEVVEKRIRSNAIPSDNYDPVKAMNNMLKNQSH